MHCLSKIGLIVAAASLLAACGGEPEKTEPSSTTDEASVPAARSGRPTSFGLCMTCHSDEPGRNGLGPSLFGVVGRRAGTGSGYSYSPALKAADFSWDKATIDHFIEKPRDAVPGTKMSFPGVKDPKKRAEITAYLATLR